MNLAEQEIQVSQIVYEEKVKKPNYRIGTIGEYLAIYPLILKMCLV